MILVGEMRDLEMAINRVAKKVKASSCVFWTRADASTASRQGNLLVNKSSHGGEFPLADIILDANSHVRLNSFMVNVLVAKSNQTPLLPLARSFWMVALFVCTNWQMFGGVLTYQIQGSWAGVSSTVEFSGFVSYDTSAPDQLGQLSFGRFVLTDWNVLVDVNHGGIVTSFTPFYEVVGTGGELDVETGTAGLSQEQAVGADLIFEIADGTQFGVTIGFQDADPNLPWVFPDGALLTSGFVEGIGFPDDINGLSMTLNPASQISAIPEPSFVVVGAVLLAAVIAHGWRHRGVRS